ncbi:MAG: translation initiation factor IF-2 [Christensenellales bacterium]
MSKLKVYELTKELKVQAADLLEKVRSSQSQVSEQVNFLKKTEFNMVKAAEEAQQQEKLQQLKLQEEAAQQKRLEEAAGQEAEKAVKKQKKTAAETTEQEAPPQVDAPEKSSDVAAVDTETQGKKTRPPVKAKEEQAEKPAAEAVPAAEAEPTSAVPDKPAAKAPAEQTPQQKTTDVRPGGYGLREGYNQRTQGGVAPRDGAGQRPQGAYAPREGGAQRTPGGYGQQRDGYQQRTPGTYAPREGGAQRTPGGYGQQRDGYQQRTPGTYAPREGGAQQRTPGGYGQQRDGYQQRTPGTYAPREGGAQRTPGGYGQQRDGYQQRTPGTYAPREGGAQRAPGGYGQREGTYQRFQDDAGKDKDGGFQRPQGGPPRPGQGARYGAARGPAQAGRTDRPRQGGAGAAPALLPTAEKEKVSNYDPNKNAYVRNYDSDKKVKSKRTLFKENYIPTGLDDERFGAKRHKRRIELKVMEPIKIENAVITGDTIIVKELAEKIGKPSADIIKKLFVLGIVVTINQEIDYDTAQLIASDFGVTLAQKQEKTFEFQLSEEDSDDHPDQMVERPPIVTIMGHVDHGKTSLLDMIRKTNVTAGEAGGITQHIGAYMVNLNNKLITFLDTPGHEAFTTMRARGAQVTDIAVLVVAADDGVMPQTIEAINHAKAAKVPIIIAINKIDKEGANPERVKQALTEYGLLAEEWGGDTVMVPVSAITGEGIEKLLEMILLVAEVQELRANPLRLAKGTVIETQLDKGRGPVATVLVQNGTLHVGDTIVAGTAYGRVRAMMDDKGERVLEAYPSYPVEVIGFSEVPTAGDTLSVVQEDRLSRQVAEERRDRIKADQLKTIAKVSLDDLFSRISEGTKELNLVIKCDVQGSVEALSAALEKLSDEHVRVNIIHGGVGAIREHDVMLASASNAIIIGFNVRPEAMARAAAETEKVDIRMYRIIYNAIEDIQKAMKGMLEPVFKEVVIGHAEIRETFKISGVGTIAGCYVTDGKITRNASLRVLRDNIVIHEGSISSLKRFKNDAKEVAAGYECGMSIENFNDIKVGDVFEAFVNEEVKQQ